MIGLRNARGQVNGPALGTEHAELGKRHVEEAVPGRHLLEALRWAILHNVKLFVELRLWVCRPHVPKAAPANRDAKQRVHIKDCDQRRHSLPLEFVYIRIVARV